MKKPEESQIRNVIATPMGKTDLGWVCRPADYVTPDRICGVCKKHRLKPFDAATHRFGGT
jgi:hypothetical protein